MCCGTKKVDPRGHLTLVGGRREAQNQEGMALALSLKCSKPVAPCKAGSLRTAGQVL